jgi:plasmid stabilization system protein ParE
VKVWISKRAARAAERIDKRWREHADIPGLFALELLEAVELLESTRSPGSPFPTARHPGLKRLLLRKSSCHLYFELDHTDHAIRILDVWDGRRRRPPKL